MTHDTLLRIQTLVQVERFAYKFISPGNILLACRIPMIFPRFLCCCWCWALKHPDLPSMIPSLSSFFGCVDGATGASVACASADFSSDAVGKTTSFWKKRLRLVYEVYDFLVINRFFWKNAGSQIGRPFQTAELPAVDFGTFTVSGSRPRCAA